MGSLHLNNSCKHLYFGMQFFLGSFEIHVNDELVYSKLDTLAFPDFKEVKSVVKNVSEGKPATKVKGQQPILDCRIV